jgi:hypothetical protein
VARSRYLKPDFFDDTVLARCSHSARLLYAALWTLSDRVGVFEWEPAKIKKYAFGYDSITVAEVESLLAELVAEGRIKRGEHEEKAWGFVPRLSKHQHFHRDETPRFTRIAEAIGWIETPNEHGATPVPPRKRHRASTPDIGERISENGERRAENATPVEAPLPPPTDSIRELHAPRVALVEAKALFDHWREVMVAEKRGTPELIASPLLLADAGTIVGYACGDLARAKRVVSTMVQNPEGDEHWARRKYALELLARPEQFKQADQLAATLAAGGEVAAASKPKLSGDEKHRRYEERRKAEEARIDARNRAEDAAHAAGQAFDEAVWEADYARQQRRSA